MSSIGVVLTTACPRCRENFPVNAITPALHCPQCSLSIAMDIATWKHVLEAPALDGPQAEPGKDHVEPVPGNVSFVRNYVRKNAACARCSAPIPLPASLDYAARGWCVCVNCGDHVSVRAFPAEFGHLGGVSHLLGEDLETLSGHAQGSQASISRNEIIVCPSCGGNVPVDTTAPRAIGCRHCRAQIVIAEDVWTRLHPLPTQRTFYLWHDAGEMKPASAAKSLRWGLLYGAVADNQGNVYLLDQNRVISLDSNLQQRWSSTPLSGTNAMHFRLAFSPRGAVLLGGLGRHGVIALSCADGSTVATLGGKETADAKAHGLDFDDCFSHAVDVDGSILGLVHDRILRWTAEGAPIETWPSHHGIFGGHQTLEPLFSYGGPERQPILSTWHEGVDAIGSHPTSLKSEYAQCFFGWDGSLYLLEEEHFAKLDRSGKRVFQFDVDKALGMPKECVGFDSQGNSYLLLETKDNSASIYKISADGRDKRIIVDGMAVGTPINFDSQLVVLPDGTMLTFDHEGAARIFAPDGSARFISPAARERDEDKARQRAEADQ